MDATKTFDKKAQGPLALPETAWEFATDSMANDNKLPKPVKSALDPRSQVALGWPPAS